MYLSVTGSSSDPSVASDVDRGRRRCCAPVNAGSRPLVALSSMASVSEVDLFAGGGGEVHTYIHTQVVLYNETSGPEEFLRGPVLSLH